MFGKLPELFNRNFAVGFFLPVITFNALSLWLGQKFMLITIALNISTNSPVEVLVGTTIFGLLAWLSSIILLAVNRDIYRFMEGYGRLNPLQIFHWLERYRY